MAVERNPLPLGMTPRLLTKEAAAAYCSMSPDAFEAMTRPPQPKWTVRHAHTNRILCRVPRLEDVVRRGYERFSFRMLDEENVWVDPADRLRGTQIADLCRRFRIQP